MNWYKESMDRVALEGSGHKTEKIESLSRGQLLNLVAMELLADNPDRERLWTAMNSLIATIHDGEFKIGEAIMEKVTRMLWSDGNYSVYSREWPMEEQRQEVRKRAIDLLREIMNEFM